MAPPRTLPTALNVPIDYFLAATLRQYAVSLRPFVDTFFFGLIQPQLLFAEHCVWLRPLHGDALADLDLVALFFDFGAAFFAGFAADFFGVAFALVLGVAALDLVDFAVPAFCAEAGVMAIGPASASVMARAILESSFIFFVLRLMERRDGSSLQAGVVDVTVIS
jgi:hypothetical protein